MIKLSDYLNAETVFELGNVSRAEALARVIDRTLSAVVSPQEEERVREQLTQIGADAEVDIGEHVVLSHARIEDIDRLSVGAGFRAVSTARSTDRRLDQGEGQSSAGAPPPAANALFLFAAVPESAAREYLRFLARLARWASEAQTQAAMVSGSLKKLLAAVQSFDEERA